MSFRSVFRFEILVIVTFALLVFGGSLAHPLWGDEAETALFARNILTYGVPKGWDGVNLMGIDDGVVLNRDLLNVRSPWAQYYLAAFSFKLFGQSSFTARLPFILLSISSIFLYWHIVLQLTKKVRIRRLALIILCFSVQYILFSYQARYYSVAVFSALGLLASALHLLDGKRWATLSFIGFGILFFYANYLKFTAFLFSLILVSIVYIYWKRSGMKELKAYVLRVVFGFICIASAAIPWFIFVGGDHGMFLWFGWERVFSDFTSSLIRAFVLHNDNNVLPVLLCIVLIGLVIFRRFRMESYKILLFSFVLPTIYLIFLSGLTSVYWSVNYNNVTRHLLYLTRYTVVVIPFFTLTSAVVIDWIWAKKRWLGVSVLALLLLTNVCTLQPPESYFLSYVFEIIHPYRTPQEMVAEYLLKHSQVGQTAFVTVDNAHEPLEFLLGTRIKFIDRVRKANTILFPRNYDVLPPYIYGAGGNPDWIIRYGKRGKDTSYYTEEYREIPVGIDLVNDYVEIMLPVYYVDTTRPELYNHLFYEVKPTPRNSVYIYKKK